MTDESLLDELLDPLRAEFHARRRNRLARVMPIEQALQVYVRALELEAARELAATHGLKQPARAMRTSDAARALLNAVQALPDLNADLSPSVATPEKAVEIAVAPAPPSTAAVAYPFLTQALLQHPLVIVGGASPQGRSRILPKPLLAQLEWVDTRHQGTRAIGNLEKRIRERRVVGLVLVEGQVQHKHTDPLLSAARAARVPCAYAGKGGALSVQLAIDEIEKALGESNEVMHATAGSSR